MFTGFYWHSGIESCSAHTRRLLLDNTMRLKKSWQRAWENARALNVSLISVFTDKTSLQESLAPETCGKIWIKENSVEKNQTTEHLGKLDTDKSMGPHRKLPQVPRELADGIVRPFLIIFGRSLGLEEVSLLSSRKRRRSYRLASLTSKPGASPPWSNFQIWESRR